MILREMILREIKWKCKETFEIVPASPFIVADRH